MTKAITTILAAFALILTGCGPAKDHPFEAAPIYDFDSTWSAAERESITGGFAEWPTTIDAALHVWRVTDENAQPAHCKAVDAEPGIMLVGYTWGDHDMCLYVDEIARRNVDIQRVAAHEYGHALGVRFDNPADPIHYAGTAPSIMLAEYGGSASTPQAVDIAALPE